MRKVFFNMKHMKMKKVALLFSTMMTILSFSFLQVLGQDYSFRNITYDQGMNSSIVYKAVQDKDGMIWFALHDGIDKFNGYEFKHYELISPAHPGATNIPHVRSLILDKNKQIWAFSDNGLFRYDYLKDEFILVKTGLKEKFSIDHINLIHEDYSGRIWLGTNSSVLIYDLPIDSIFQIPGIGANVLSFYSSEDSKMWIGTGNGLFLYDQETNTLIDPTTNPAVNERMSKMAVFSFWPYNDNQLLLGSRVHGLRKLNLLTGKVKKVKIPEFANHSLTIRDITYYNDKILLGTDGAGLIVLDSTLRFVHRYTSNENIPNSLSYNAIYDLFVDKDQRLWISTVGGGVNIFDPNDKAFTNIRHLSNNSNSLNSNMGLSISEDSRGNLWFGTDNGISILNRNTNIFKHIGFETGSQNDLSSKNVKVMIRDARDNIWVGTFAGGIDIYNESTVKLKTLRFDSLNNNSLSTDYIYALYLDNAGDIWAGGIRGGVNRYNPASESFTRYDEIINVRCFLGDSWNRILVGSLNGLYYSDETKNNFTLFHGVNNDSLEFVNRILCIHEDKRRRIWIGSEGEGLSYLEIEKGVQKNYLVKDGLPSNIIYGILEDSSGNLWLSTTNGLSRFDPENEKFTNFTTADHLSGKEFNNGSYFKTSDTTFIFGGNRGFTLFRPNEIKMNEKIPEILFTNFFIFHEENKAAGIGEQKFNVNETERIVLNHDQNSFSIEFSALNYTSTEKNLYRWKLDGLEQFENSWTNISNERRASFNGLPPGNYQFMVQASNNDGFWNTEGRTLEIVIQPSIWRSKSAKIIYILLTVIFLFFIQRYIYLSIKERNAFEKIRFFINIAHDIRTPLTLIKGPVEELISRDDKTSEEMKRLQLIADNADRLNNLVNQLLDFQKADLNKVKLTVSETSITEIVNKIIRNFEPLACKKNISINHMTESDQISGWADRAIIERIMYNLLSNAIKYSYPGGDVTVTTKYSDNDVVIIVSDQGRGIPPDQQKNIFKRYHRSNNIINTQIAGSGVGLMLTKKLVELHRGSITFVSKQNSGTSFTLNLPVNKEEYNQAEIFESASEEIISEPERLQVTAKIERNADHITSEQTKEDPSNRADLPLVLIVEDNDELRSYLRSNLIKSYRVETASHGNEGLELTNKHNPDLIITDIMMPEMDGIEFCKKIRQSINTSHIPVILLTALNSMQQKIKGLEYGADDYIEKPFEMKHLIARIDNLLTNRQLLRKKYLDRPGQAITSDIRSNADKELMEKILDLVMQRFNDSEFSVEIFCREIGISRPVLYRKLKAYTDQSPQDYIKIIRLKKAEELLLNTTKSVKEIAYEVGFSDPRYFSVSFKKYFGQSPTDFIQN